MSKKSFSCLIPFYNENTRIFSVLETIARIPGISQIICIDDGSTDNMGTIIKKNYPDIIMIQLSPNKGKTYAIKKGIEFVSNDYVILVDADLQNLKSFEIARALDAFLKNDDVDMLILRRINAPWFVKLNRADLLFSGERILSRKDLMAVLYEEKVVGYQLEIAINTYMQKNNKKVCWIPSSAINTQKVEKMGLLDGLKHEKLMVGDIISYSGYFNLIKQILLFGRKRIKNK